MVKVFGHKAPDTDTVCSAIIWAWYLNNHSSQDATAYVLGDLNTETEFALRKWGVEKPELLEVVASGEEVVIVDTTNPQELPENINETTIVQIIDHHKLTGGLSTAGPLDITVRPLASTATILYDLMDGVELPDYIAGLILSCILSDTLEFRSPTTTPHDKDVAEKLAAQLGVNVTDYAMELFAAKSDVSSYSDSGLVKMDSKKYDVGDKNLRVSVLETTTPDKVLERKAGIIEAIGSVVAEEGDIDDVLLFIIDILNEEATVLTYNDLTKQIVEASFGVTVEGDTEVLPGVVSRKKQIIPTLKV